MKDFTGDILRKQNLDVIDYEGRLYLAKTDRRYDVVDLSLADSAGLSSPGGFPIVEKFAYTREAMESYMRALENSFFVVSSYLSTATVLYKNGGFTAAEIAALRDHTRKMSFDEIYYPGIQVDTANADKIFKDYDAQLFGAVAAPAPPIVAPVIPPCS